MHEIQAFPKQGFWYQGNTHAHTNRSDGKLSPQELIDRYRRVGHHFTAITDHRIYSDFRKLSDEHFLVLPGIELDVLDPSDEAVCHHLVGLGLPGQNRFMHNQRIDYDGNATAQDLQRILAANGQLCIYAHPNWSHMHQEMLPKIDGLWAMEIYNHTCEVNHACGESSSHYDRTLRAGKQIFCLACDDAHQNKGPDLGGGFIRVKAPSLTEEDLFNSLLAGAFYATQGPSIKRFDIVDDTAVLETSGCRTLAFSSNRHRGYAQTNDCEELTHLEMKLDGSEAYVRALLIDRQGRKAWSQPIWLDEERT